MSADESKTVLFGKRKTTLADFLLDTAAVNNQSGRGDQMRVLFQPESAAAWVDGE
jgi:hypothetical protein